MAFEFDLNEFLQPTDRSVFEPRVPNIIGSESFPWVRTTGVRYAPEVLVLELFREVFFTEFSQATSEKQLSPSAPAFGRGERAILYIARGRAKHVKLRGEDGFYAPVYPEQAREGWLRKKSDRALRGHLLEGALAHSLKSAKDEERRKFATNVVDALHGRKSASSAADVLGKEILSATAAGDGVESTQGMKDRETAIDDLAETLTKVSISGPGMSLGAADPLASRIREDFGSLCDMEGELPRLMWLELLKCFLRLAVPAWVLAQMKLSVQLRDWVLAALEMQLVPTELQIQAAISARWTGLFHPSTTGSNELVMHVDRYMKARVELSLLLYLLRSRGNDRLLESRLSISSHGKQYLSVEQLLGLFSAMPLKANCSPAERLHVREPLIRCAETFAAWADPLHRGQGKNVDEFLRSLRRFEPEEADTGYLAERKGTGLAIIFPGPSMIRLVLLLAARVKNKNHRAVRGKFILADLERHFCEYGLDFSSSAGARPRLLSELARLGLLKGSPDAGDYTEVLVPIDVEREPRQLSRSIAGSAE